MINEDYKVYPDLDGHFGVHGGRYVGETLMEALLELNEAYRKCIKDKAFMDEYRYLLKHYVGRPSPIYYSKRLSDYIGGAKIYLKREDLNHTGAHKVNNTIGQVLLAKHMGKTKVIAETGAGQHGVATATTAALFGFECKVFMGVEDIRRQQPNVQRMELLGAEVVPIESGTGTLKDAMNGAIRYWASTSEDTFYIIGSVAGPHPYPEMVRDFQKVIGQEAKEQFDELVGGLPDCLMACVGGGSNAMGLFYEFLNDTEVEIIGVEAAGKGIETGKHAVTLGQGSIGILHGSKSYILQDENGMVTEAHSVSAGLDYPGVGPEHSLLKDIGRVKYESITDKEALNAFVMLSRLEGIIPALESSHALAQAMKHAAGKSSDYSILVCLSGRGDKDLEYVLGMI